MDQQEEHFFRGRIGGIDTPKKAFRPISRNCEPDSKVTDSSPTTLIDAGRMISTKPAPANAFLFNS
jgi:hypothetical protein